jgi:SprT protein
MDNQMDTVTNRVEHYINVASKHYRTAFPMPEIIYQLQGRTAGQAISRIHPQKGISGIYTWKVDFNVELLKQNMDDFLKSTVPHEVAHLIDQFNQKQVYNYRPRERKSVHGPSWKGVMRVFGVEDITRCHSYDTSEVTMTRVHTKYDLTCACIGKVHKVGAKVHHKVLAGALYTCKRCKTHVKPA